MSYTPLFTNRTDAGEQLAQAIEAKLTEKLNTTGSKLNPIVYALPRGGLPVAAPVADLLNCPLTVAIAKKIGHPENAEYAIGAVSAGGKVIWAEQKIFDFGQLKRSHKLSLVSATNKAKSLEAEFLPACPQVNPNNAIAILVDDGIATGMTIAVAAVAIKELKPAEIWLCTPVAPTKLLPWLGQWCDRLVVLATGDPFYSVSSYYLEFPQVTTEEALEYLRQREKIENN